MYPILTIVFIGIIIFTIRRIYVKNKEHSTEQSFWDREQKANLTSKADITNLSYITIPMEKFPLETTDFQDEKLIESLKALSEKRILCLNGFTNTDGVDPDWCWVFWWGDPAQMFFPARPKTGFPTPRAIE